MFKCPFVSVKALEDAFYRLLSFTDSCQYWCKEWRTLAQTMLCCLTAPAPTLSLNITHPTILNIECEAERGNIADIGTGHCWQLARCWGQSLHIITPLLSHENIATQALLSAVGNESIIFVSTYNEDEVTLYWLVPWPGACLLSQCTGKSVEQTDR